MALSSSNQPREQAEFNASLEAVRTMMGYFQMANVSAIQLDVYNWHHALLAVFRELSVFMKDKEVQWAEYESDQLLPMVCKSMRRNDTTGRAEIPSHLYKRLHKFHLFFMKVFKDSGLYMKMQEDAWRALR